MDLEETLALLSAEQPARWLQYRDGTWAPVWENGLVGEAFTTAELHTMATAEFFSEAGGSSRAEI